MPETLQSDGEEQGTSKEELKFRNEELETINRQLQDKIRELEDINNDLSNLLVSTDIATVLLDRRLHIRRYTPSAARLLLVRLGAVAQRMDPIDGRPGPVGLMIVDLDAEQTKCHTLCRRSMKSGRRNERPLVRLS